MASKVVTLHQYKKRFIALIKHPFFWILTIVGNSTIIVGSAFLFFFENSAANTRVAFIDCLLWATGLVTTIGYGDFTPQTTAAKIVVLLLMMIGILFVWSYMAFLVTGIMAPEISSLEKDVHEVEKEIRDLKKGPDDSVS